METHKLDARTPSGPIEDQWDKSRFEMKLVNPANRRKHKIIVVGAGLAGAAASAGADAAAAVSAGGGAGAGTAPSAPFPERGR